ncbi:MAG: O-methyltransferase [Acidimicrobiia bacterium]|nr:O-methyltransferase [Acidimicrobiia bacterium]
MQRKTIAGSPELQQYVLDHSEPLERHHLALIEATNARVPDLAAYQVPPEQALALRMLTRITGARRVLEIGTFTGLSAMLIAEGLGPEGRLICLDIDPDTGAIAREHWEAAGLGDRIELVLGPAADTLDSMAGARFDLVFLDADKPSYIGYLDRVLPMLDHGGLVVADNTLMRGHVLDPDTENANAIALRAFNRYAVDHPGVDVVMMPVYDGLTLIRRR